MFKEYKIKEGKHDYFNLPKLTIKNSIEAEIIFTYTWQYDLKGIDQLDINKVIGISDNWTFHQIHSARFGVRYNLKRKLLELFSYTYSDKELLTHKVKDINIGQKVKLKIELNDYFYLYFVDDILLNVVDRKFKSIKFGLKYILLPYFGGNKVAPHDIITLIKWI